MAALTDRLAACGLAIHTDKTHVVYCKDGSRKEKHPNTKFDFLGYTLRPRVVKNRKRNSLFVSFTPAVSESSQSHAGDHATDELSQSNRTELAGILCGRFCKKVRAAGGHGMVVMFNVTAPVEGITPWPRRRLRLLDWTGKRF